MARIITGIIFSYLIGSIPTAYIFGRALKGIDIRDFGSGNMGATNALRVLGKKAGITVLFIDILKGLFSVAVLSSFVFSQGIIADSSIVPIILGMSSIVGHNWTIFLNFKGGKGVATTFGVLIGLSLKISGFAAVLGFVILVWFLVFFAFRIVAIASVTAALAFPVFILLLREAKGFQLSLICFSFLAALFIVIRHLPNLRRAIQGKEQRLHLGFKK
ncbi:MAG: glycerol-3-phosphate 1-O-acyltransferase PlsY [Candidatus Omnitrophota bacterium]